MRKKSTMFLLVISLGLLFSGAVSAQEDSGTVNVTVTDENGDNVTQATEGDEVNVNVVAENTGDEDLEVPYVIVNTEPESDLEYKSDEATMEFDGTTTTNDPNDPFFYFVDGTGWVWDIGVVTPGSDLDPDEVATLIVPAIVHAGSTVTVTGDFFAFLDEEEDPTLLDSDSYSFQAEPAPVTVPTNATAVQAETVGMEETGAPIAPLVLGFLTILGGLVSSRKIR